MSAEGQRMTIEQQILRAVQQYQSKTGRHVRAVYLPWLSYGQLEASLVAEEAPYFSRPPDEPPSTPRRAIRPVLRQDRIVFPHGFVVLFAENLSRGWAFLRPLVIRGGASYHFRLDEVTQC
jgi:hypothetical protein